MSKIGRLNLEAQEEVNTLGYSSVEEAIADGWDSAEWFATYEQEKAHEAYLKEKEQVLNELRYARDYIVSVAGKIVPQAQYIDRAINFIEKGEV